MSGAWWPAESPSVPGPRAGAARAGAASRSGQDPGPAGAGQAAVDQGPQVQPGAPVVQPGVVLGRADVAEPDPAAVLGGDPGDGPLDARPGRVGALEPRRSGLGAGFAEQALMRVDGHRPAIFGGGAPLAQGASGAGGAEGHGPVLAHLAGDAVRAGDGAAVLVHDEVIDGEAAGHRRAQRPGLDDGVVPAVTVVSAGLAAAVRRVAVHLQPLPARRVLPARRWVPIACRLTVAHRLGEHVFGLLRHHAGLGGLLFRRALPARCALFLWCALRPAVARAGIRCRLRPGAAEPVAAGHLDAVLRIGAAFPGGHRHLTVGDQAGARLGGDMPAEPVAALRLALAGVAGLAVHGADDPVRSDPAGPGSPGALLRRGPLWTAHARCR